MEGKNKINIRQGWLSIIVNIALFGLKYWAGIVSGSVALIADAWHTLSDSASSAVLIIGSKIASRPADQKHPFGHGRAEHITAIIIGILLLIVAFEFTRDSILQLYHKRQANFGTLAIIITIVSVLGKELLAQIAFWGYRKNRSKALKADAWHHRTDAISSVIVLVGILVGKYIWWVDGVLGIIVSIMIAYTSYRILREEFSKLLGEAPSPDIIEVMKAISFDVTGRDNGLHHFHIHQYGDHTELSFHIKLSAELTLDKAHGYCSKIEEAIFEKLGIHVTIHAEPFKIT